jgi:hypothetical protein
VKTFRRSVTQSIIEDPLCFLLNLLEWNAMLSGQTTAVLILH